MTTPDQLSLAPQHVEVLGKRGIPEIEAVTRGVRSILNEEQLPEGCPDYWTTENGYLPGLLFPWVSESGQIEYQLRPDVPPVDEDGRPKKYVFRGKKDGHESLIWAAKTGQEGGRRLLVEGTCQTLAAAVYAPADVWVYGMAGCRGWMSDGGPIVDLMFAEGTDVIVALDADMWSNVNVWDAGEALQHALNSEGADSVRFLKMTGKKTGLDDLLGRRPAGTQSKYLENFLSTAMKERFSKAARKDLLKKHSGDEEEEGAGQYFGDTGLLTKQLAEAVYGKCPAALTREGVVAVYKGGVFHINPQAFNSVIAELLEDMYRPAHVSTVHDYMAGTLYGNGTILLEVSKEPVLNVRNGMLNLRTGELLPHSPSYLSGTQIPVYWDPEATCPNYEAWLKTQIPDQIEDLEEAASTMLDPSRTPSKALFLFGPSRSGKSTFLRLMQEMAGSDNVSGVTLHQLVENRFMAANVYGKMLNVAPDLVAAHVDDLSIFKMMTGEDLIQADRKHGSQFAFTNRALFAFSANTLPTVGEGSNAYTARIKPFKFGNSFEGKENPEVGDAILAELPGILVRWVKAWQRMKARGHFLKSDEGVMQEFERKSDRVKQFLHETCQIGEAGSFATATEISQAFKAWAEMNNSPSMGRNKIAERLTSVNGVQEVRDKKLRRGYNIRIRKQEEWGDLAVLAVSSPTARGEKNEEKGVGEEVCFSGKGVVGFETAKSASVETASDAFNTVLSLADKFTAGAMTCENCDEGLMLVPPAHLIPLCPNCHPASFGWQK